MYCPDCGAEIQSGINFCPYCGTALNTAIPAVYETKSAKEYQIILVLKGTCEKSVLRDILSDVFGYSDAETSSLVSNIPVQIAQNLSDEEAAVIAQMFAEYGAEVTVLDENQVYVDLTDRSSSSIFNADGSLLAKAAAVIGALTIVNRVTSYRTVRKPSLLERIFRPLFTPKTPGRYVPMRPKRQPVMTKPIYRNTMEHRQKPVTGHFDGPNGRMKRPGRHTR